MFFVVAHSPPIALPAFGKRSAQAHKGRRHQGSMPDGRDSAQSAGRSPRTRRRHAGMPSSINLSATLSPGSPTPIYAHTSFLNDGLRQQCFYVISITQGERREQSKPMGTRQAVCRSHWLQRERGAPQGQRWNLAGRSHLAQSAGWPHLFEPCRVRAMGGKHGARQILLSDDCKT